MPDRRGLRRRGRLHPLTTAYLHVTQRCNLECAGCYSLDDGRNSLEDAPTKSILRAVGQLAREGVSKLIVSGGEPFLRGDLPEIVRFAKKDCSTPASKR